jgi:hypothetical protein
MFFLPVSGFNVTGFEYLSSAVLEPSAVLEKLYTRHKRLEYLVKLRVIFSDRGDVTVNDRSDEEIVRTPMVPTRMILECLRIVKACLQSSAALIGSERSSTNRSRGRQQHGNLPFLFLESM